MSPMLFTCPACKQHGLDASTLRLHQCEAMDGEMLTFEQFLLAARFRLIHQEIEVAKDAAELWQLRGELEATRQAFAATIGGTCRICGCTDLDCSQCIERTGSPCFWANGSRTLCSACAPVVVKKAEREVAA